uniref:Myb-like protein O n=1 Tax=Dermatophagoides pteronyssinus TaxID=6956 RepID=A0A6P6Y9T9_DERPT|nr:myb-like protein O [Dermatophagoides pteronyssinus]
MSEPNEKIFYIPDEDYEDDPSTLAYYDDSYFFDDYEAYWDVDDEEDEEWVYCNGNDLTESFEIVDPATIMMDEQQTTSSSNNNESNNLRDQESDANANANDDDEHNFPVYHANLSDNQEESDNDDNDEYFPIHHANLAENTNDDQEESNDEDDDMNQHYHYLPIRRHSI